MEKIRIAFDVGGTFSKGMVFSEEGQELLDGIGIYESYSHGDSAFIIQNFVCMITDLCGQLFKEKLEIQSIGLAFPGPFDYEEGVSLIKDLEKFDSLYGVNIKQELTSALQHTDLQFSKEFKMYFENDARCFAIGEYYGYSSVKGGGYFTLGTGFGSTFIYENRILTNEFGLPASGMVYGVPYKNSMIDDYLSARGLEKIVQEVYGTSMDLRVPLQSLKINEIKV